MISPRDGIASDDAIRTLAAAEREASNVLGAGGSAVELMARYLTWTTAQERSLANCFSEADVARLLLTRRYWAIQASTSASTAFLAAFVSLEINSRITAFTIARQQLELNVADWRAPVAGSQSRHHLHAVVIDTNVLMRHPEALLSLDWASIAGTGSGEPIAFAISAVVVEELDRLKHTNGRMTIDEVPHERRWLATLALSWLDKTFPEGLRRAFLDGGSTGDDPAPLFAILLDENRHDSTFAKADSDIIDNALRLRAFANSVTLASYDSHMIFAARHLGLRAHKLAEGSAASGTAGMRDAQTDRPSVPSIDRSTTAVAELEGTEPWLSTES